MSQDQINKRLKTIKRSIEFNQKELHDKIKNINKKINNKHHILKTFDAYLSNYNDNFYKADSKRTSQFLNYQNFLEQINKTILDEKNALNVLEQEKETLHQAYQRNLKQIGVIDESLKKQFKLKQQQLDKKTEQIETDQWLVNKRKF